MKILKDEVKEQFKISIEPHKYTGGQSIQRQESTVVGKHEKLGIEIKISYYRQIYKNRELVQTIFDLMFDELIK